MSMQRASTAFARSVFNLMVYAALTIAAVTIHKRMSTASLLFLDPGTSMVTLPFIEREAR